MAKTPKFTTSTQMFASRGDPWTTDKEGEKNYGRNLFTENPDLERYTAAGKAKAKREADNPKPVLPPNYELRRTLANKTIVLNRILKRRSIDVK